MANILVTGAAGYLGSTLVPRLLQAGHQVAALDDFRYDERSLLPCARCANFSAVRGDARDEQVVRPLVRQADVIIPMAAIVGSPACQRNPSDAISINRDAVLLLNRLRSPRQRILFPTTSSGYGKTPSSESCTESTPLNPISLYGRTKVEAEAAVLETPGAVSFRLATVFGVSPRMRLDLLVNDFTNRALRDGSLLVYEAHFVRNYVAVQDVAELLTWAVDRDAALPDGAYNFGLSEANLSKRQLCETIAELVSGFTWVESQHGTDPDQRNYIVSNEKIELAGFKATTPLKEGIRELITALTMISSTGYGNI